MLASDIPIWDSWVKQYGHLFIGFDYDIHVGEGVPPVEGLSPALQRMAKTLTQKRIDALGHQNDKLWIIEVKQRPGVSAVGQIITYLTLFRKQFQPDKELIPVIVGDIVEPDIRTVLAEHNILWFEV